MPVCVDETLTQRIYGGIINNLPELISDVSEVLGSKGKFFKKSYNQQWEIQIKTLVLVT